jgi:hypothetical protein
VEAYWRKLKSRGHDWLKLCFCSIDHSNYWNERTTLIMVFSVVFSIV